MESKSYLTLRHIRRVHSCMVSVLVLQSLLHSQVLQPSGPVYFSPSWTKKMFLELQKQYFFFLSGQVTKLRTFFCGFPNYIHTCDWNKIVITLNRKLIWCIYENRFNYHKKKWRMQKFGSGSIFRKYGSTIFLLNIITNDLIS